MRRNVTRIRIYILFILSLATGMIWTGYQIYQVYNQNTTSEEVKKLIEPLNSNMQTQGLDELEKKQQIPVFSADTAIYVPIQSPVTPTAEPSPDQIQIDGTQDTNQTLGVSIKYLEHEDLPIQELPIKR